MVIGQFNTVWRHAVSNPSLTTVPDLAPPSQWAQTVDKANGTTSHRQVNPRGQGDEPFQAPNDAVKRGQENVLIPQTFGLVNISSVSCRGELFYTLRGISNSKNITWAL